MGFCIFIEGTNFNLILLKQDVNRNVRKCQAAAGKAAYDFKRVQADLREE